EDGIRDFHVTGVQTCALPICSRPHGSLPGQFVLEVGAAVIPRAPPAGRLVRVGEVLTQVPGQYVGQRRDHVADRHARVQTLEYRSEERRVGKEDKSGWCARSE